jgi:2-hydroxychromene-2-carboxylate isomerase
MKTAPFKTIKAAMVACSIAMALLTAPVGAQDKSPFPITKEYYDANLNAPDSTWPKDPAVPDLPPLPDTDDPPPPPDNFLRAHYYDGLHPPTKGPVPRLTAQVTEEKPLKADVIWSMRSPYSYIVLQRLVWLQSNYNVELTIRPVMPIAVRSTKGGSGKGGGAFGVWYKLQDAMWDTTRMAQFNGLPFKWPTPDPIWQNIYPQGGEHFEYVHPPEKQPYIGWVVRLGCYAQLKGKSLEYVNEVSSLIFGDHEDHWPAHVKERFNRIEGLDYDEAIEYIQKNTDEIDAIWLNNNKIQTQAGHGGVPLMIFQGEPFFGGDRFDPFVYRLWQSGLTKRSKPRAPFTTKPLRWPAGM